VNMQDHDEMATAPTDCRTEKPVTIVPCARDIEIKRGPSLLCFVSFSLARVRDNGDSREERRPRNGCAPGGLVPRASRRRGGPGSACRPAG
jgi:hypothetical protein